MPPRKSNPTTETPEIADTTMLTEQSTTSPGQKPDQNVQNPSNPQDATKQSSTEPVKKKRDEMTIDDLLLPRTITQRICKGVLPPNTSIHRDAALALTKSATVFVSLLASEANALTDKKTIQSPDIIKALREIELGNVMQLGVLGEDGRRGGRVEREVEKWEGDVRGKRRGYREKVRARTNGDTTIDTNGDTMVTVDGGMEESDEAGNQLREGLNGDEEERRKRVRVEDEQEDEQEDGGLERDRAGSVTGDTEPSASPEWSDEEENEGKAAEDGEKGEKIEEEMELGQEVKDGMYGPKARWGPNGIEYDGDSGEDSG